MRKIFLSLTVILTFIFYSLYQRTENSDEANIVIPRTINSPPPKENQRLPQVFNSMKHMKQMSGQYRDGEYTGIVSDAYYGNEQVKVIITGGKITDVQFLQYPNDRRTSIVINTQAMPYLKQEAIQAQNANVDIVSGATQTSKAFKQSLQSALDQAKM